MSRNEGIVTEIGVLAADAIDFLLLAGTEAFIGIEAPQALHQTLPAQHFVAARDAAVEIVGNVEERAVAIRDAGVQREQISRHLILVSRLFAALELPDRACGPNRPASEQSSLEIRARGDAVL